MIQFNRTRRATLKARARATRAAARIARRGNGTLASHALAAGLAPREARSVAGALRKNAGKANVSGTPGISYAKRIPAHTCTRYTPREVALICLHYKPRKPAYRLVAARLALAA